MNKPKVELGVVGDAEGIAKVGRAFDVTGSPEKTRGGVFLSTLIGELVTAGHHTLQRNK